MSRVALVKCAKISYERERIEEEVRVCIELLGGMRDFVRPGQRVLVKPNLLRQSDPSKAIVTHPHVVRAVVKLVQEAGGIAIIGDSPGGLFRRKQLTEVYDVTGMSAVAEETGATLNYDVSDTSLPVPDGVLIKSLEVANFALDADVIISLPKWKTHELMGFTGATKNMFGVVPGVSKAFYHAKVKDAEQFADVLLDILTALPPAFSLMDAVIGMHGDGPSNGEPFSIGCLLASTDAVGLDLVATYLAGIPLDHTIPLRRARDLGLITGRIEDLNIVGADVVEARVDGFRPARSGMIGFGSLPPIMRRLLIKWLVASPQSTSRCVACGVCVQNCPVNAIRLHRGGIRIDLGECIRCYCCRELCPEQAIDLSNPWLKKVIR